MSKDTQAIENLKAQYGIRYEGRLVCRVCGARKTHYRLYGYRCHNPQHGGRESAYFDALLKAMISGAISEAAYDMEVWGEILSDSAKGSVPDANL